MISAIFFYNFSLHDGKKPIWIVQKFMTCNYMRKDVTVDFYILYNAAVRD